jgi:motility quorum-sensing regulator/GCU-specific mRNA interferase toxin
MLMEKRKPHYDLAKVQGVVRNPDINPFTIAASDGGVQMGLNDDEMRQVILNLTRANFHKSMTTHANSQYWQDVYHGETQDGDAVYIKITDYPDGRPPIIQFKEK